MSKIHLCGIGGVGMAGLAVLLKARGHDVDGCDLSDTPRTAWLRARGIPVAIGHDAAHVRTIDELIVTPAVPKTAPELAAFRARGQSPRFRGEVLADLVGRTPSVAVCGSHGKTTTATWTARLLLALGEDVEWCIGGETGNFPVAGRRAVPNAPRGSVLVVEADESDGSLAHYRAQTLVVNPLDYDHPDHFPTPADYFACFETARRQSGDVIESARLPPPDAPFEAIFAPLAPHNRINARAVVEVALRRGHAPADIAAALPAIVSALPDRRFQKIAPGIYTDYAHHPKEMACAIAMARQASKGRVIVLFQPHRYSRTKALLREFPEALRGADEVILCPTYAAFEQPIPGGGIEDLAAACRAAGIDAQLAETCESAWNRADAERREGDLVLLLGAGDIIRLAKVI